MSAEASTSSKPTEDYAEDDVDSSNPECSVCLQTCVYPLRLPICGHLFCFLCIKGVAYQSLRCPMCRKPFEAQIFKNPDKLVTVPSVDSPPPLSGNHWYYKGNAGWWAYDERSSSEIEAAFSEQSESLEMLIAGKIYVIDFESMTQYQKRDPRRKREIKRDATAAPSKGVAGLRVGRSDSPPLSDSFSKLSLKAPEGTDRSPEE